MARPCQALVAVKGYENPVISIHAEVEPRTTFARLADYCNVTAKYRRGVGSDHKIYSSRLILFGHKRNRISRKDGGLSASPGPLKLLVADDYAPFLGWFGIRRRLVTPHLE